MFGKRTLVSVKHLLVTLNGKEQNTGTLQKGIIGPVLVNAINNSSIWILDK